MQSREAQLERETTARVPNGFDPSATFVVLKPFVGHIDGLTFQPGELVDSSLIGGQTLRRLFIGKSVRLANQ
jgi:hypothetical protein